MITSAISFYKYDEKLTLPMNKTRRVALLNYHSCIGKQRQFPLFIPFGTRFLNKLAQI